MYLLLQIKETIYYRTCKKDYEDDKETSILVGYVAKWH